MRILWTPGYLAAAVFFASILAWVLDGVVDYAYSKVLSRGVLLFLAAGLFLFWRFGGFSAHAIGLRDFSWKHFGCAVGIGWAMVLPLMLVFLVTGFRAWDTRVELLGSDFITYVLLGIVSSLLVGLFEEVLFRGLFFAALKKRLSSLAAAIVVSLFYAVVHFYDREVVVTGPVAWHTGFSAVGEALIPLAYPAEYWDSFAALFLLGLFLCWVRVVANLWFCVGLHAAWVFAIKVYKELTVRDIYNPLQGFAGSYDNFVGPLASIWLVFAFVCIALYQRQKDQRKPPIGFSRHVSQ